MSEPNSRKLKNTIQNFRSCRGANAPPGVISSKYNTSVSGMPPSTARSITAAYSGLSRNTCRNKLSTLPTCQLNGVSALSAIGNSIGVPTAS
eukprot:1030580-Pyramimonas_sp.AAC.1